MVVTWGERERRARADRRVRVETLRQRLAEDARRLGVVFVLYGSTARGEDRPDSDVDILVEAEDEKRILALEAAEAACRAANVVGDIRAIDLASPGLIARARAEGERFV